MLNVRSLWVMTSVLNAFSFSPGSYPYADKAFFTTPYPPLLRYEEDGENKSNMNVRYLIQYTYK